MTNLITQPYRRPNRSDEDNYLVTLAKEFDLVGAVKSRGASAKVNLQSYLKAHPSGKARLWAVGNSAPGKRAWEKMSIGDLVVFYGSNEIYAYGEIASKTHWANNDFVWPTGNRWDFIYSLRNFSEIPEGSRPIYQELRRVLDKLDVQSVGIRSLTDAGISKAEFLEFLLKDAKKSAKRTKVLTSSSTPRRNISERPPKIGEKFRNRQEIWQEFGGQYQQGIATFPGDSTLNVFSDEEGPYPDYQNPTTGIIEYRGQGLVGGQKLSHGNKALELARLSKLPIRFWLKPAGGIWTFEKWVLAADREAISEEDSSGEKADRILWYLVPIPSPNRTEWTEEIEQLPILTLQDTVPKMEGKRSIPFSERYSKIVNDNSPQPASTSISAPRINYKRSRSVRQIVIERSNNKCEFDACTGMPPDIKQDGSAILEVDHIEALGEGGVDHPSNMIALCPNCHEAKTHGAGKNKMIKKLKEIVSAKESEILRK